MKVPMMRRHAERYHKKYEASRRKQAQEEDKHLQQSYGEKGKGQWKICGDMDQQSWSPLSAVRRIKGSKLGPKGSIATSPKEVDEIIREQLSKIYDGDVNNQKKTVDKYIEAYSKYMYEEVEATM